MLLGGPLPWPDFGTLSLVIITGIGLEYATWSEVSVSLESVEYKDTFPSYWGIAWLSSKYVRGVVERQPPLISFPGSFQTACQICLPLED